MSLPWSVGRATKLAKVTRMTIGAFVGTTGLEAKDTAIVTKVSKIVLVVVPAPDTPNILITVTIPVGDPL
jgi:hypothetical protein